MRDMQVLLDRYSSQAIGYHEHVGEIRDLRYSKLGTVSRISTSILITGLAYSRAYLLSFPIRVNVGLTALGAKTT